MHFFDFELYRKLQKSFVQVFFLIIITNKKELHLKTDLQILLVVFFQSHFRIEFGSNDANGL